MKQFSQEAGRTPFTRPHGLARCLQPCLWDASRLAPHWLLQWDGGPCELEMRAGTTLGGFWDLPAHCMR